MYAVIETGGKQYKVQEGTVFYAEKLEGEIGSEVTFKSLCTFKDGSIDTKEGKVTGKILKTDKAKKINIFTYKPKKSSSRKMGHRQPYTKIEITKIG